MSVCGIKVGPCRNETGLRPPTSRLLYQIQPSPSAVIQLCGQHQQRHLCKTGNHGCLPVSTINLHICFIVVLAAAAVIALSASIA